MMIRRNPARSRARCPRRRQVLALGLGAWLVAAAGAAQALTIDLRGAGGSGGFGNSLVFGGGGLSVTASAWAETGGELPAGSGYYAFQSAEIHSWSTGLGICNRSEGLAGSSCDSNEHEVDTVGRDDLLVLVFNQRVSFLSITVDPYDGPGSDANDRDILYRVGDLPGGLPNLANRSFASLGSIAGLGAEQVSAAASGYGPLSHALSGVGNVLLVSGNYHDRNCFAADVSGDRECEAYKIASISVASFGSQVVPLPAGAWLLGSALGTLVVARRRGPRQHAGRLARPAADR